ncbi:uncharacterized protein LOC143254474 [Tachypleus tridentatus]|uniref:uncharacterized protein LOC143254474 n=1 Tax=Tachypleus tridentatus TaxID=6853 RepID=UPI003FCF9017
MFRVTAADHTVFSYRKGDFITKSIQNYQTEDEILNTRISKGRTKSIIDSIRPILFILRILAVQGPISNTSRFSRVVFLLWRYALLSLLHLYLVHQSALVLLHLEDFWDNTSKLLRILGAAVTADIHCFQQDNLTRFFFLLDHSVNCFTPRALENFCSSLKRWSYIFSLLAILFLFLLIGTLLFVMRSMSRTSYMREHYYGLSEDDVPLFFLEFLIIFDLIFTNVLVTGIMIFAAIFYATLSIAVIHTFRNFNCILLRNLSHTNIRVEALVIQNLRLLYQQCCSLVSSLDAVFCRTISVWYALVIICVCVECTSLFTDETNELLSPSPNYVYAALQIGYLLLVFFLTSLVASQVPEEAASSVDHIHALTAPYNVNNIEFHLQVQLFVSQMTTNNIGLTGWKFFVINRGVILTILGAIISYMVIVIQMNPVAMNALGG